LSRRTPRFFNTVACRPDSFDSIEWLRYYIDFYRKYNFWRKEKKSFAVFVEKNKGKEQAEGLGTQAHHAVSFFYGMDQCSAEKVKNDIPPAVKGTISEQASIYAAYFFCILRNPC